METIHELFNSLESNNPQAADDAKKQFHELFISTKESWLLNGMFDYYLQSSSGRAVDVLICVREPHDRYLFDRLSDTLRGSNRLSGLTLLGHVVRRHPSWIYKIANHSVFKDLIRVLKSEKDAVVLMSALFIIIILLPIIASLISSHLQDLFEVFSHLAMWSTNNPHKVSEGYLLHLDIGMYALFNRLYGMFPCNFLSYLRQHYSSKENLPVFSRTIKPMLDTVRMHPLLVTASKELETSANRWKKIEANDVIIECAKFSIESNYDRLREDCSFRGRSSSVRSRNRFDVASHPSVELKQPDGFIELGNHGVPVVSSFSSNLPETGEVWNPAVCSGAGTPPGPSSIPQTPIIQGCVVSTYSPQGGNSPPEAAIEATPESTPIKDMHEANERAHSAVGASVVRSLGSFHSQPSSPLRKEHPSLKLSSTPTQHSTQIQRVHRVMSDRNQVENIYLKGKAYPPGSPLRVIQVEKQRPHTPGDRSDEDREVETTFSAPVTTPSHQVTREDSVLGESIEKSEDGEWREWREGGGLKMPEGRTMTNFVRRLRYFSQCQPEHLPTVWTIHGLSTAGSSPKESVKLQIINLRKTSSCPDLAKQGNEKDLKNEKAPAQNNTTEKILISSGTQTDPPQQPLAYEHLLLSIIPPLEQIQQHSAPPDVTSPPTFREDHIISSPRAALDSYIDSTVKSLQEKHKLAGVDNGEIRQLKDQLILLTLQLQFERHRREVHAERNRRLLGRYRENRVLEEHNSALRDQVQLLQTEIEKLHNELNRYKKEAKVNSEKQQESLNYWEEQNSSLQRKYKDSLETVRVLSEDLKEEKRRKETIAEGYTKLEAEVFGLRKMMDDALAVVQHAEEAKSKLSLRELQLQAAGELEVRYRSYINDLLLTSNRNVQDHMAKRSYLHQINVMQKKIDAEEYHIQSANEKLKEAEDIFAKKEALIGEQNKLIESIKRDCEQQLRENEEVCTKLRELNTRREIELLRLQAEVECLEEKVKRLSTVKTGRGLSPQLSNSPHLSSGSISIAEEKPQIQNLQLLVDRTEGGNSSSKDTSFPP